MKKENKEHIDVNGDPQNVGTDAQKYSGVAVNMADDEKVNKKLVDERTATLNNNPRNDDL